MHHISPQARKPLRPHLAFGALLFCTLAMTVVPMPSHAIEEPEYQVVRKLAGIEVQRYAAHAVVEVIVPGPASMVARQAGALILPYIIFGLNKGKLSFVMTAPLIYSALPGGFLVQFALPKNVTLESAPQPLDARVQLRKLMPTQFAVIRYSDFGSESKDNEHLAKLQAALRGANLAWEGEAIYTRYGSMMPRNEIGLRLAVQP